MLDDEQYISDYYEDNEYLTAENINDSFDKLCSDNIFFTNEIFSKYFICKERTFLFVCTMQSKVLCR